MVVVGDGSVLKLKNPDFSDCYKMSCSLFSIADIDIAEQFYAHKICLFLKLFYSVSFLDLVAFAGF